MMLKEMGSSTSTESAEPSQQEGMRPPSLQSLKEGSEEMEPAITWPRTLSVDDSEMLLEQKRNSVFESSPLPFSVGKLDMIIVVLHLLLGSEYCSIHGVKIEEGGSYWSRY